VTSCGGFHDGRCSMLPVCSISRALPYPHYGFWSDQDNMKLGLDVVAEDESELLAGRRIGLIVNASSVNSELRHATDVLRCLPAVNLACLFGPQHGMLGNTQDNMVEWETFVDRRTGLPAYSLYGDTRKPLPEMLSNIDTLVFDVQDIGTRVYTFIYTMALAMEAAAQAEKSFIVLDRPNPIGGTEIEGNIHEPAFKSFVGMYPIPMRHGMTAGELAQMFNHEFGIGCDLHVVRMKGWRRDQWFDQTELPWVMPSPNMPTLDTAAVYPGAVLLEGTNISEGRGTTRPFEMIGAPFIDPHELADSLNAESLPGVAFRPIHFEPTFHKYKGELCGGLQVHVTDRDGFKPVITGVAIVSAVRALYMDRFDWKDPPYEYVYDKLPFDLIAGTKKLREQIEAGEHWLSTQAGWRNGLLEFEQKRRPYLLYD
jgi:uncharacterized protein YbbC (DUF1343 family)